MPPATLSLGAGDVNEIMYTELVLTLMVTSNVLPLWSIAAMLNNPLESEYVVAKPLD